MEKLDFNKIIGFLCCTFRLTIRAFAKELGVSHAQVSRWQTGVTEPGAESCIKIHRLYLRAVKEHLLPAFPDLMDIEDFYTNIEGFICEYSLYSTTTRNGAKIEGTVAAPRSRRARFSPYAVPMPPPPASLFLDFLAYTKFYELGEFSPYVDLPLPDMGTCMCRIQNMDEMSDAKIAHDADLSAKAWRDVRDSKRKPDARETEAISWFIYSYVISNDAHEEIFGPISPYDFSDDEDDVQLYIDPYLLKPPEPSRREPSSEADFRYDWNRRSSR